MPITWKKLAYEDDVILKSIINAKGDLIVGSADNVPAILTVGADGRILKANSSAPYGVEWSEPGMPGPHHETHENGGSDEINVEGLSGELADPQKPKAHASSHENGGADEINVTGLSGELADPQTPKTHAANHKKAGSDSIKLNELADPDASIEINKQQLLNMVFHRVANEAGRPGSPEIGQAIFQMDTLSAYICVDNTP
jgi:hypothetical protein